MTLYAITRGAGAPAMVVQGLTLSSMLAFSAAPSPFWVLLGLLSASRRYSTSSCRQGFSCAAASQVRTRRRRPLACFAKPVVEDP